MDINVIGMKSEVSMRARAYNGVALLLKDGFCKSVKECKEVIS